MLNNHENFPAIQNSANPKKLADSHSLVVLNDRAKLLKEKSEFREKLENQEHKKADKDLENGLLSLEISNEEELNIFLKKNYPNNLKAKQIAQDYFNEQTVLGFSVDAVYLKKSILNLNNNNKELLNEDQIKNYKEELANQGKSQTKILSLLISKFENEESVSIWVENWKNYQGLWQFAETKTPVERQAIQNIIARADFSSSTAFETSLSEITQSTEISQETKLEISREFDGSHIDSVDGMDYQLEQVKAHKKAIEKEIGVKYSEKESLDFEIEDLNDELDSLPLDDPKRQELEDSIEKRKEALKQTKNAIDRLEKGKPKDVSFQLREGFSAKLNPDGSRSIRIDVENFAIKIPSNRLPFTNTKNLRAINLAFPYLALKNQNLADVLFKPNIENNTVPSKSQRDMGYLILSSLGIDHTRILSEGSIEQLKKDVSKLTLGIGTGMEKLIELGIYDIASQRLNKNKLKEVFTFIRKNRGINKDTFQERMKKKYQ